MDFLNAFPQKEKLLEEEREHYFIEIWYFVNEYENKGYKLKAWRPKQELQNEFVKEIWLNESRQLGKLKSVTNANSYLELIKDSFVEGNTYCLIYPSKDEMWDLCDFIEDQKEISRSSSRGRRLSIKTKRQHWLLELRSFDVRSRVFLWKNILRIIKGIEILHQQNIIHRNINVNSILFDNSENKGEDERFYLGGFEKSLDFNKLKSIPILNNEQGIVCTTHEDWKCLGSLILNLMDIDDIESSENKLSKLEIDTINKLRDGVSQGFTENIENIRVIEGSIERIIDNLANFESKVLPKFYVTAGKADSFYFKRLKKGISFFLNETSNDENASKLLTNEDVYNFLKEDLNIEKIQIFHDRDHEYLVQGINCLYAFSDYKDSRFSSWSVIFLKDIIFPVPNWLNYKEKKEFHGKLTFVKTPNVDHVKYQLSEENSWELKVAQLKKERRFSDNEISCLQGLLLSLAVEATLIETNKFIVSASRINTIDEFKEYNLDIEGFYYSLEFKQEDNSENKKASKALSLKDPFIRFKRYFQQDEIDETWIIEPNKSIKDIEREEIKTIQFIDKTGGQYIFLSKDKLELELNDFENSLFRIYPSELDGDQAQIKRKIKSFNSFMNYGSLIESLSDPTESNFISARDFEVDHILKNFDDSKKEVFESLIKTQPNYFIKGPPGVGKTYLITNYVKHLFEEEPIAKILLSAQAHSTVKLLSDSIIENLQKSDFFSDLIIIRDFKGGDKINDDNSNVIKETTLPFVEKFQESEMYKINCKDKDIRNKLNNFIMRPDRDFFKHILRSANLVFTTTNSRLMSDIVQENINFDVSILEEAAKATGLELISPMMASNKRVMIGDYKQLPAFAEPTIKKIINNPTALDLSLVLEVLEASGLRNNVSDEMGLKRHMDHENKLIVLRNMSRYFSLFQSLSKDAETIRNKGQESFGNILNIQHRMHPDIANIVSTTVYDNTLNSHPKKVQHFNNFKPFYFKDSLLEGLNSDKSILWVDIPDKQSQLGIERFENSYVNEKEIEVVRELLSKITTDDSKVYSIKVLSPYFKQVSRINKQINIKDIDSCFSIGTDGNLASTVDSFQGNEADVIIISMVRHNSFTPISSALGFLSDMRRMNVLLSRAKYKLIIVGCFGLFKRWQEISSQDALNSRNGMTFENKEFLDRLVDYCILDYETMRDSSIEVDKKNFKNVNFVSSTKFLKV